MEKHYFVPVINRIYTNRNDRQYRCTGVVESSRPWETVAYITRLSELFYRRALAAVKRSEIL